MTFAEEVRKILNNRGMTIAELSFDSRVQEATIRRILDRNSNPRLDIAKRIADGLGVSLDTLVESENERLKHLLKNVDPPREKDDNNNGDER
jgi:transcriptional regulator with XRE-family HTH domain